MIKKIMRTKNPKILIGDASAFNLERLAGKEVNYLQGNIGMLHHSKSVERLYDQISKDPHFFHGTSQRINIATISEECKHFYRITGYSDSSLNSKLPASLFNGPVSLHDSKKGYALVNKL